MKYIGFGGNGFQLRDVLHISDLCELIFKQIKKFNKINNKLFTVGGSWKSNTSLKELTKISFYKVKKTSLYDIPYYISDNRLVSKVYKWKPKNNIFNVVNDMYLWLKKNKSKLKKYF